MSEKPTKKELRAVHAQALKRADEAWTFERDNIRQGREDQRFYAGDQWDEAARKARGDNRPMLTVNRLGTFVRQVTGDLRQNPPAIKVSPAGGEASQEKADIFSGMIRSIEVKSDASACYVKAASNVAQAGQGAFRINTRYVSETSFDQEIVFEQIADPFGVLIDPLALAPDKSDMAYGYVFERLSKEAFKASYPNATADDMPIENDPSGTRFQWVTGDSVRIAEYWCRETEKKTIYLLQDGTVSDVLPKGQKPVNQREVDASRVVMYVISGKEVLSGPHEWAGKFIPICFIPGEEITIDGATKRKGMIRDAKDPQKLLNYARTTDAEQTALQPKAPFILTKDEIKGYEVMWNTAGTKNHPYLLWNRKAPGDQAPQRSQPPAMSSGLQNLSVQAGEDLHNVIGIYPASLGAKSNETSGVAIRARQNEGDTGSNYILDNTKRAIAYAGRILCDLIPKIYDSERIARIRKEDGTEELVKINEQVPDPTNPGQMMTHPETDLTLGEYDVVVSTGPSYLTRQQEMADTIVELSRNVPAVGQVAPDLLVKALNFPGGDEIAKRLERTIPPNIKDDNPQPPPPDPEKIASAIETKANADLKNAQTAKTLLEADQIAATLGGMPQQIQMLTEMVKALAAGQQPPQQQQQPPQAPSAEPPPGAPVFASSPPSQPMQPDEGELVDMPTGQSPFA